AGDVYNLDISFALTLSDAELDKVTAGVLRVGRTDNAGNIAVSAPITQGAGYSTLSLLTGGGVQDNNFGTDITVPNLAIRSATGAGVTGSFSFLDPQVTHLAVANSTSGAVQVSNTGDLFIVTVDGFVGVSNPSASVTVLASGNLTIDADVTAGGSIDLESQG